MKLERDADLCLFLRLLELDAKLEKMSKFEKEFVLRLEPRSFCSLGPVGVELAGEILTKYPNKKVTIVDAQKQICSVFPEGSIKYLTKWLEGRGCKLVLGTAIAGMSAALVCCLLSFVCCYCLPSAVCSLPPAAWRLLSAGWILTPLFVTSQGTSPP
jgi:hypothetical protein